MVGEIVFYQSEDGTVRLETRLENETLWLTINQIAELFSVDKSGIGRHLKNIFATGELRRQATVANFATVQNEGGRSVERDLEYYNLDAIISVGYRVNSIRGTQFRIWATQQLKEYIIKGFVMDDERLKNPLVAGSAVPDYFDEMLARVREIFALAADYAPSMLETNQFFSTIQNKLHFAVTGMTAAEIIAVRQIVATKTEKKS
ncbi:MAG: RhuM family protein [Nitrosomonas sp.]|nr:virulence RhuM family protein [Nitrosomonas sp.]